MAERRTAIVTAGCVAGALAVTSVAASIAADWTWAGYVSSYTFTNTVIGLALALCGVMIGWFRPRNPVGVVFLIAGLGHLISAALAPLSLLALEAGAPQPLTQLTAAVVLGAWWVGLPSLFMLALLLFPDGRLPSPRWRVAAWLIVVYTAFSVVLGVMDPVPTAPGEPASVSLFAAPAAPHALLGEINVVVSLAVVVLVVGSLILRYVRGDERMRRQLLWLILAALAMLVLNLQRWITGDGPVLLLLSTAFLPIAIAIAIVRYQLLDIRVVLSRALVYGVVIGVIIAIYAGLVATLTWSVPGAGDPTVAIVAAVTVALVFNPLRLFLQRVTARAFFGTRSDPGETAKTLNEQLRTTPDTVGVIAALRTSLRFPHLAVIGANGEEIASDGTPDPEARSVEIPLFGRGDRVGVLTVTLRPGEQVLHDADRRSLSLVAPLIGMVLREQSLAADLRAARAQTVEARESERQVLHRDLHDGLGPTLTSAALRIDAAQNVLDADAGRARAVLTHARADVSAALAEVRRVVYGLRPIPLDERGLVGALQEQAEHPAALEVEVTAEALPELSAATELAAYRVAIEGIANANRHSSGSRVVVDLAIEDQALRVTVVDDGIPAPGYQPGVGIRSITERVEELGGTVSVGPDAHGWRVCALLPLRA
ncbi:hypothetical protein BH09ACT3_BH09ACT3_05700 [soil metagenome]